jgi:hypothetical protein
LGEVSKYKLSNSVSPENEFAATPTDRAMQVKAFKGANIFVDIEFGQHLGQSHSTHAPPLIWCQRAISSKIVVSSTITPPNVRQWLIAKI